MSWKNDSITKKQKDLVAEIAQTLRIKAPNLSTKGEASVWLSKHHDEYLDQWTDPMTYGEQLEEEE